MSGPRKRSVTIRGHRTSFSLEEAFYLELEAIAQARRLPLAALIAEIDETRPREINLSSSLRLHVLDCLKSRSYSIVPKTGIESGTHDA